MKEKEFQEKFKSPMGMGVSTDHIFVADTCNEPSSVKVFSRMGDFKKELEHPDGKWRRPSAVCVLKGRVGT